MNKIGNPRYRELGLNVLLTLLRSKIAMNPTITRTDETKCDNINATPKIMETTRYLLSFVSEALRY
jgi:hypothetical protein